MKKTILICSACIYFFCSVSSSVAKTPEQWSRSLFNAVRFADNGNSMEVHLKQIKKALDNGADPNWINKDNRRYYRTVITQYLGALNNGSC